VCSGKIRRSTWLEAIEVARSPGSLITDWPNFRSGSKRGSTLIAPPPPISRLPLLRFAVLLDAIGVLRPSCKPWASRTAQFDSAKAPYQADKKPSLARRVLSFTRRLSNRILESADTSQTRHHRCPDTHDGQDSAKMSVWGLGDDAPDNLASIVAELTSLRVSTVAVISEDDFFFLVLEIVFHTLSLCGSVLWQSLSDDTEL
jgi:hypothetical protein